MVKLKICHVRKTQLVVSNHVVTNPCCSLAVIFCGFISLLIIIIGYETINIPEIFSGVHGFTGKTVICMPLVVGGSWSITERLQPEIPCPTPSRMRRESLSCKVTILQRIYKVCSLNVIPGLRSAFHPHSSFNPGLESVFHPQSTFTAGLQSTVLRKSSSS